MSTGETVDLHRFKRDLNAPEFPVVGEGYLPENVVLDFYFTPHVTAEHFDEGAELLAEADVFIPELVSWTDKNLRLYNAISKGDARVYASLTEEMEGHEFGSYAQAVYSGLYGTWKPVAFIDADNTRKDLLLKNFKQGYGKAITADVETTLDGLADVAATTAEISLTRDTIMVGNLGRVVTKLVTGHPKLSSREEVNVLLSLGLMHSPVYEAVVSSDELRGRVTAHHWADRTELPVDGRIVDLYKRGETPAYEDIAEFLVKSALVMVGLPTVQEKPGPLYNENAAYKRTQERDDIVGEAMVKAVMDIGNNGLEVCRKVLRQIKLSRDDMELLRDAHIQASSSVD